MKIYEKVLFQGKYFVKGPNSQKNIQKLAFKKFGWGWVGVSSKIHNLVLKLLLILAHKCIELNAAINIRWFPQQQPKISCGAAK